MSGVAVMNKKSVRIGSAFHQFIDDVLAAQSKADFCSSVEFARIQKIPPPTDGWRQFRHRQSAGTEGKTLELFSNILQG